MSANTIKLVHSTGQPSAKGVRATRLEGLLALLVTDIAGFTSLVEQLGDVEAQAVIRTHNDVLRACIRRRQGQEVAHTGDGVIAAFRSVIAAIGCAHDLQLALARPTNARSAPLRARIGIHAGEPLPEEERLFGQCVNTAARVCGKAEPGRVLVTEVIEQLARGRVSFGPGEQCMLKGMSRPITLYSCDRSASSVERVELSPVVFEQACE
jgi:class 3 adenylate cyclase